MLRMPFKTPSGGKTMANRVDVLELTEKKKNYQRKKKAIKKLMSVNLARLVKKNCPKIKEGVNRGGGSWQGLGGSGRFR